MMEWQPNEQPTMSQSPARAAGQPFGQQQQANPFQHPQERRQQLVGDRRKEARAGKFDRRKNRCGGCTHFAVGSIPTQDGFCQKHALVLPAEAYACRWFEPISN